MNLFFLRASSPSFFIQAQHIEYKIMYSTHNVVDKISNSSPSTSYLPNNSTDKLHKIWNNDFYTKCSILYSQQGAITVSLQSSKFRNYLLFTVANSTYTHHIN